MPNNNKSSEDAPDPIRSEAKTRAGETKDNETVGRAAHGFVTLVLDRAKRDAWVRRLATVERLNISAAETELHLLELFTIQMALRTAPTQKARTLAPQIFERFLSLIADAWHWERDSLSKSVTNRIESYGKLNDSPVAIDAEDLVKAIGIGYAMMASDAYSPRDKKGELSRDRFATALAELFLEKRNVLTAVGRDVFRDRFKGAQALLQLLAE